MPSRDSSGKPLSGAALRRKKKAASAAAQAREAKRRKAQASPDPQPAPQAAQPIGLDFASLPPPPLNDPLSAMVWWNNVLLVCADKVMRDPHMPLEQRVRFLSDFAAKGGMIRDKSAESKAIRDSLRKKDQGKEAAGLEDALGPPPPKIPRPAL